MTRRATDLGLSGMERMHSHNLEDLPGIELLRIGRDSIEYGLVHGKPLPVARDKFSAALMQPGATFSTLRLEGELRGCCGTLEAYGPLAQDVAHSAFRAAYQDPRFDPVRHEEFNAVRLEVSVLSPLETIPFTDEDDLMSRLTPGVDGLVIIEGRRRATFLPKVWESLPDPRDFLARLKGKCGLPADYWSERLEFQRYSTLSYAESA